MENVEINTVILSIDDLTPDKRNARKHQAYDVNAIKKSIEKYGFNDPVGVWGEKNIIVEGHGRVLAARELGMTELPCIRLDHLSDKQRRAYAIMHNKTAELSEWDYTILNEEMQELDLADFDIVFDESGNEIQRGEEEPDEELGTEKKLFRCPCCGHINEEKAFKYNEDTD